MKISKRANGSFVMRVDVIEATIRGDLSIKEVWQLYEKLSAAIAKDESVLQSQIEKEETKEPTVPVSKEEKKQKFYEERLPLLLKMLEEHKELKAHQMFNIAKIDGDKPTVWSSVVIRAFRDKKIKRKKDKDGKYIYFIKK
jgi:hypothetical protein